MDESNPLTYEERIRVLTQPEVLDALAPEHNAPRYEGNECDDETPWNRRAINHKENDCLRCRLLCAREDVEMCAEELYCLTIHTSVYP